ncbi:NINE protein [Rhodococcus sp. G-MC3]|uniref:TM2 domain-containing protein n=1 Tax=Rhodococcus sp. G-MC3 TaxID=3046209 RepID=UPI0024B9910F|nr:TM2 domain-containing protein [Rhodococcus sp. G-MC3]MDJ0393157.1 NINE protein [Rhodococcus sp. G-MC3]
MTEPEKNPGDSSDPTNADSPPEFSSPFDYDATAEASLSEPPATSETGPVTGATGSGSGSGPGWDVHSGIGNGPGWGESPSYPPPTAGFGQPTAGESSAGESSTISFDKSPGLPESGGVGSAPGYGAGPTYGAGPVYGPPDANYPQSGPYDQSNQGYPYPGNAGQPDSQGQPGNPQGYPPPGYQSGGPQGGYGPPPGYPPQPFYGGYQGGPYGVDPMAPYGRHPITGEPLSDKSKLTGGLLGILLGAFGAGRFYLNQPGIAVAQIAVTWLTCGIGGIWPLIDGIMMLTGSVRDEHGRPLRD